MVTKKEDTPRRISRRKYEQTHRAERRKTSGNFQTMIPKDMYDEICTFLKKHNIKKIELIYAGYEVLLKQQKKE